MSFHIYVFLISEVNFHIEFYVVMSHVATIDVAMSQSEISIDGF